MLCLAKYEETIRDGARTSAEKIENDRQNFSQRSFEG